MSFTRLRDLVLDNLSWKLLAGSLALLIWFGARLFMSQGTQPLLGGPPATAQRDFAKLPIRVLAPASSTQGWAIDPPSVFVRVAGDPSLLDRLTELDPLVFVEAPPVNLPAVTTRRVDVRLPPAIRVVSVIPERVELKPLPTQAAAP